MSRPDPAPAHVITPAGVTRVAVIWQPSDTAALARDLAAITGRGPATSLPDHLQEPPR